MILFLFYQSWQEVLRQEDLGGQGRRVEARDSRHGSGGKL